MESQTRNEMDATHVDSKATGAYNFGDPPTPSKPNLVILANYILRSVAFLLTLISVIVIGAAKETIVLDSTSIKSTQFSAYLYFIITNVVVFIYSLASLAVSIANRGILGRIAVPLSIGDLAMVILLFSCNGAAAAVSILSDNGQPSTGWNAICDVATKFCDSVKASIVMSIFAAVVYLLLVLFALLRRE